MPAERSSDRSFLAQAPARFAVLFTVGAALGCGPHPVAPGRGDTKRLAPESIAAPYRAPLDSSPTLAVCGPPPESPGSGDKKALDREPVAARYRSPLDGSPALAVASGGRIATAWVHVESIDAPRFAIQYALSADGGATWTTPALRDDEYGMDPALAVDRHGTFYLASLGGSLGRPSVVVATAPFGSSRFGRAMRLPGSDGADMPSLAVTPSGTVLVTWAVLDSENAMCARTTDGEHWTLARITPERRVDDRIRWGHHVCAPALGGRIWVVYADGSRRPGEAYIGESFGLQYSDDDGVTWSREIPVSLPKETGLGGRVSPSCVGDGKKVWALYGLSSDPAPSVMTPRATAIRLASSTDGGESFEAHDTVSSRESGDRYLIPAIARGVDGSLHVVYYGNGVAGAGEDHAVLEWSSTRDPGATFGRPVSLRAGLRFVHLYEHDWLGYSIGVVAAEGALHVVYVDNACPPSRIKYLRRPLP